VTPQSRRTKAADVSCARGSSRKEPQFHCRDRRRRFGPRCDCVGPRTRRRSVVRNNCACRQTPAVLVPVQGLSLLAERLRFRLRLDEGFALCPRPRHVHKPQEPRAQYAPARAHQHAPRRMWNRAQTTHRPKRNANGMFAFPSAASMIADETNGPTNAEVLPITEKRAKNRNLLPAARQLRSRERRRHCGSVHLRQRRDLRDHGLRVRVPRADEQAVEGLI
jgi:hypothetical protein